MEKQVDRPIAEFVGSDLAGWRLCECYNLHRYVTTAGFFPAIIGSTDELFMTTARSHLRPVWDALPEKPAEITAHWCLYNVELNLAYDLRTFCDREAATKPIRILTPEQISQVLAENQNEPFHWAGIVITLHDTGQRPNFDD